MSVQRLLLHDEAYGESGPTGSKSLPDVILPEIISGGFFESMIA
jgi:hypothetical protein